MNKMSEKTLMVTTGGMIAAVFAVILLINRQTGGMFEEAFIYLLPIPMVAYSSKFGMKASVPVFVVMGLLSFLFGTITTIFYAVSAAALGMVFGYCLFKKMDMTKIMFIVMALAAILQVVSTIALASVIGYDINTEIMEMQNMINTAISTAAAQSGQELPTEMFSLGYLRKLFIMAMLFFGLVQGYITYKLSILVLRKLRIPTPKATSFLSIYPPKWTGYLALAAFFLGQGAVMAQMSGTTTTAQNILQAVWIVGYMYLLVFGLICLPFVVKYYISKNKAVMTIMTILAMFLFPQLLMVLGFCYLSVGLHNRLDQLKVEKGY